MAKQVRETNAGKSISAYVILNRKGQHVATVQAHFSNGGTVTVDVWHMTGDVPLQQGRAGGYGYDKFTAALSGLVIDGHKITDHCADRKKPPKGRQTWPHGAKAPRGYSFANFIYAGSNSRLGVPEGEEGWASCYRLSGLAYLTALGYRVIQAI